MNTASSLPEYLSEEQGKAITDLLQGAEILPLSCLFYRADEHKVISRNRKIPDDFIYLPMLGALDCTVGSERKVIYPGEFMMVPAGRRHGVVMAEGVEYYEVYALHMHFYTDTHHRFLEQFVSSFGRLSDLENWRERLAVCTCLMGAHPEAGARCMEQLVTWLVVEQILSSTSMQSLPAKTDQRITRLLGAIRRDVADNWTVTRMGEFCHLSVSRFRELFSACTGVSPKKYVQRIRLAHARSLLSTNPTMSVEEVARSVGFPDAHYFHAVYREMFGETPRKRRPASTA